MISKKIIKQTYHIKSSIHNVWQALTDSKFIDSWGAGPAKMDDKVGTKFSLWGGDIYGTNKEIIKEKKLVQEWFGGKWDNPSTLIFDLSEKNGETILKLTHKDVPKKNIKDIDDGWKDYYLGPLKKFIEKK